MKKLYTAVGRMQFKGRNRDMRCPMVLLNNKEYILDIQEMMIWSILNWRILSDDEIKTLYENKAQETGYMTHRSAAECMQRLVRRGLVAEGEGELGADALFNLLSGLYVVPISESPILRLISLFRDAVVAGGRSVYFSPWYTRQAAMRSQNISATYRLGILHPSMYTLPSGRRQ